MLKPLVEAFLREAGKTRAKVQICEDPVLGGVMEALKWERICDILDQYRGMVDLFLLIIDRDGSENSNRRAKLDQLEQESRAVLPPGRALLGEHAIEELEVWVLAGHDLPAQWRWQDIRAERDPKERFFRPFAGQKGLLPDAAGRSQLAEEAASHVQRICSRCPEVRSLIDRLAGR